MTEWSTSDLNKHGSDAFMSPDDWTSMSFSNGLTSASGDGFTNNYTNTAATLGLVPTEASIKENTGLINRIYSNPQLTANIDASGNVSGGVNPYGWITQRSGVSSNIASQNGKGAFVVNTAPAAGSVLGVWHHMLKIRLVDLHPIFKELDLIGNPQLKLKIKVNAGYCDIAVAPLYDYDERQYCSCYARKASAAAGNALAGCNTATTTLRLAFGPLQNNITTLAQAGQFLPFTTSRLNIPYYDLVNPVPIISSPIKTIRYLDCFAQYFRGKAGTGASTSQQNAPINLQLSGSWKNIKYVSLIPYSETSRGHWANSTPID
ncbi:hypothetical protein AeNC1_009977 [Aphanomyces euteiches]|nr:hypothetical protein AeNC1_009977 [Aphanomyces euteiches]